LRLGRRRTGGSASTRATTGSDARPDVARDSSPPDASDGSSPVDSSPTKDAAAEGAPSEAASDAPPDSGGRVDAADAREASSTLDASDGSPSTDAPNDVLDARIGPPPGCFHYSQGASPSAYSASVPRIAPGGATAQVWAANSGANGASLFARFGGVDGGYSPIPLAPIVGSWRAADVARNGSTFGSVYTTATSDAGNSILFLSFGANVTADSGLSPVVVSDGVGPLVARGASEYGLAWYTNATYAFARMSDSGALLDAPQPLVGRPILIARTGAEYGVIHLPSAPFASPADVKLARFSAATGQRIGADTTLVTYLSNTSPAPAATGDGYVVAWWEPDLDSGLPNRRLARFDATGSMQWKKDAGSGESAAWSGTEIALLYFTTSGSGLDVRATAHLDRYTAAGDPIPPAQSESLGISNPRGSQLVWTGSAYSYSFFSDVSGLSRSAEVAIDCFVGSGLPVN
jgi:hypothetical protein